MADRNISSQAFDILRPCCVEFIQKRNLPSLKKLYAELVNVNKESLDDIAAYVLFPFQVLLKTKQTSEELLVHSLRCIAYVFCNVTIQDWNVVNEFLCSTSSLLSDKNSPKSYGSEELKLEAAKVYRAVFDNGASFVRNSLYHPSTIPLLGHIVTILLSVAQENIVKNARISSLQALRALCEPSYCKALDEGEQNLINLHISNAIACFLPGVSSGLVRVISHPNSGQKIRSLSMEVLASFIVTIIGDSSPKQKTPAFKDVDPKLRNLIVTRDEEWTKNVVQKLGKIIENVCLSSNSDEYSVRLSCVQFCGEILLNCTKTMENHTVILLNVCVKLMNDDYALIRKCCDDVLNRFSSILQNDDTRHRALGEILEENLFTLSTGMPRIMRIADDAEKLSNLKLFLGYISILKKQVMKLILSLPHLSKLATALLHCFEMDLSSVQLLDITEAEFPQRLSIKSCFRKRFKHFRDVQIYNVLSDICKSLGKYGDFEILSDYFMELYKTSETFCKQAVLVLLEILSGVECDESNKEGLFGTIKSLLDEFLSPENWYLVTTFDSDYLDNGFIMKMNRAGLTETSNSLVAVGSSSFQDISSKFSKSNVLLSCVHLDIILTSSRIMKEQFRRFLMYVLYPLLEKTVDQDESLTACAIRALRAVALNCGYQSASELIATNADYLISDISIQIHNLQSFPRCPAVLRAILIHSDSNILPLLYDTVDEIVEALDQHHLDPKKLLIFVPVLLAVVSGINRWMTENSSTVAPKADTTSSRAVNDNLKEVGDSLSVKLNENCPVNCHTSFIDDLKSQLKQLHDDKKIASLEEEPEVDPGWKPDTPEDIGNDQCSDTYESTKPNKPPMEIQVVTKVLIRCIHLMANSDPRVRIRVMEVIEAGMMVLSRFENELLPMTHQLWAPLIVRFGDKELQVVMKAFYTLRIISSCAKDFLRKRFCKDVLPKLLFVLELHATAKNRTTISHKDDILLLNKFSKNSQDIIAYKHSVLFKLQRKILSGLGPLLLDLDVKRKDHILVCKSLLPYLSSRQPVELQESAVKLFRHMIAIDSDLTWLELTRVWCNESVIHPPGQISLNKNKLLRTVYLGGSTDSNHEYASNVKRLLKLCM